MNTRPPLKGLNIRIPIITPILGRGFINDRSTLVRPIIHEFVVVGHIASAVSVTPKP